MSVKIIIDSTVDVSEKLTDRFLWVPLTICFGSEEFIDGVTINHQKFYEKLVESDVMPTTSQATPAAFEEVFRQVTEAGDTALVLTISSALSGTYQSACIAAEEFPGSVYVVDTKSTTIGAGILAQLALKLAEEGMDAKALAEKMTEERENIRIVAMLDTLEYLKRGGRISKTVAFAGNLLSIKPVISLEGGQIKILGKARGSKQGNNLLVQEIQKAGGVDFEKPILLGYTGLSDVLLQKYITDSAALWQESTQELECTVVGSVVGTHAGPGAVAVAFFKKN